LLLVVVAQEMTTLAALALAALFIRLRLLLLLEPHTP
jgi:hypothetical protein